MNDKILFIDTETGGLDPSIHKLLSIGLVVWYDNRIIDSLEILINDESLITTTYAMEINRIDLPQHNKTALSPVNAVYTMMSFLERNFDCSQKITVAGHNITFDVNFLKYFLKRNNVDFNSIFSHRHVDTSSILYYLYLTGILKEKSISSQETFDLFNISVPNRHSALGDAIATAILFFESCIPI